MIPGPRWICTASINGGERVGAELTIEFERIDITAQFEPDPTWQHVDPAGHYHARSVGEHAYPTLKAEAEHVDCDDPAHADCEGYTRMTYQCIACAAPVKPRTRQTVGRRYAQGRESWSLEVSQHVHGTDRVSVVIDTAKGRRFGFAVPTGIEAVSDSDGMRVRTRLVGDSPLGERQ